MSAIAIFSCRQNSHPFQERHVSADEPVKIGRSVARARPAPNNAIFDCKVLSRNHALLWYENGVFYLQDTKSSNGTFVNNQRLSKGSEESPPQEIFSGDSVQFGVDVMENSRRVTHSCIIATIQLFHPDGREAKNDHSSPFLNTSGATLGSNAQELYQISQYLQEALHREQMLEMKLATLQRLVSQTQDAAESGWQALIDEDRLLSRLEVLENQLATYSKNQTEDTLRQELTHLQEDKYNYETTAKESLRKVLQEKVDAVRKLSDLERALSNTEDECGHLRDMCDSAHKDLDELAEKYKDKESELSSLQDQLQELEKKHSEELALTDVEKSELQAKLQDKTEAESMLQAQVESLEASNDFSKEQLANFKAKMEALKENNGDIVPRICEQESQGVQVDLVNLLDLQMLQGHSNESDVTSSEEEDDEEAKVKDILDCLDESIEGTVKRKRGSNHSDSDSSKDKDHMNEEELKEKLKEAQSKIEDYKCQLEQSSQKLKASHNKVEILHGELEQAKSDIFSKTSKISSLEEKLHHLETEMNKKIEEAVTNLKVQLSEAHDQNSNSSVQAHRLKDQVCLLESQLQSPADTTITSLNDNDLKTDQTICSAEQFAEETYKEEIDKLKGLLDEANSTKCCKEKEADQYKNELVVSQKEKSSLTEETNNLRTQLEEAKKTAIEKLEQNAKLRDQLQDLERSSKDVRQQIITFKGQLLESEQTAKLASSEAEKLRFQVRSLQEELEYEHSLKHASDDTNKELQAHASETKREFISLKEECASLRERIQDIENEMRSSRTENHKLQTDYTTLQASYHELEQIKDRLEDQELVWRLNLTDTQKESDQSQAEARQLFDAHDDLARLTDQCDEYKEQISVLETSLSDISEEYEFLSYRSYSLSFCSMIPLLLLGLAILLGFYPWLSAITATQTPSDNLE